MAGAGGLGAIIGGGLGLIKGINNKLEQDKERKRREMELLLSPWTGMEFKNMTQPRETDPLGDIATGVTSGFGQGQAFTKADAQNRYNEAAIGEQQAKAARTWDDLYAQQQMAAR